ncbi:hypothetical protein SAMN06297251_13132, partial [Fulvimarina manganoxydans]
QTAGGDQTRAKHEHQASRLSPESCLKSLPRYSRKAMGIVGGSVNVIGWSLSNSVRALGALGRRPGHGAGFRPANDGTDRGAPTLNHGVKAG